MSKRLDRRAELERAAAAVSLEGAWDVIVCGGGAAGLAAAIAAAEQGARTAVVEGALECGRSILATGGGRCNFANRALEPGRYNDPAFVEAVCGDAFLGDVLEFFRASGLAWTEEDGRLYPMSLSAASVRDVLLARAERAGAVLACGRRVERVEPGAVITSRERIDARSAIIACGGGALPDLPLASRPAQPVLCPLSCEGLPFDELDGRRVRAEVALVRDGAEIARERGEVLFRGYGLSGIVIFDLSRAACAGDDLVLDLAPDLDADKFAYLVDRAGGSAAGIIDPLVAAVLGARKNVSARVLGAAETSHAQVSRGGLATSQFDPATLMAPSHPGLFACGEALDIDGACGGFNLAWAWKSGMVAGRAAAAWAFEVAR